MKKISVIFLLILVSWTTAYAQVCRRETLPESTPNGRYTLDNTTAIDNYTHLEWQRCPWGQTVGTNPDNVAICVGPALIGDWGATLRAANNFADTTKAAGQQGGWRLPNVKELISIIDVQCFAPPFNQKIFPSAWTGPIDTDNPANNPVAFWASTPTLAFVGSVSEKSLPEPMAWGMFTYDGSTLRFTRNQTLFAIFVRNAP
ncbi:MAG: DUF1566 domain-containing protein [Gammaproteobacteria bacterium]|nr:DUF1566 domain-containing protein [Gammaproteobacteria bacterium]